MGKRGPGNKKAGGLGPKLPGEATPVANAPKVLGAVRPEDRLPLPAVRRRVMCKEKGAGGLGSKLQTVQGGPCPTCAPNP